MKNHKKRFALFHGEFYYPNGGWDDLKGFYDDPNEAKRNAPKKEGHWWHIVDLETRELFDSGDNPIKPHYWDYNPH